MPMSEQADETMWPHSFLVHLIPVDCEGFAPISQIATLRPKECDLARPPASQPRLVKAVPDARDQLLFSSWKCLSRQGRDEGNPSNPLLC